MPTDSRHAQPMAPNLLDRNFTVTRPNAVRAGDITCICTRQGWLYLATVLDLFRRGIVGWSMSAEINWHSRPRAKDSGLTFHSDNLMCKFKRRSQ